LFLSGAANPSRAADADTAERDYKAGQYQQAMDHYQKAAESDPARSDLQFNRGDAAYKAGDFSEAEEAFRKSLETPDLGLQEQAYFNLGNAQFQHGAAMQKVDSKKTMHLWQEALHSFDSAMRLKTSADSQHNYEYVKEKIEELKKQQQSQGGQDQQNQPDSGDQGQTGQNQQQGNSGGPPQNQAGQGGSQAQPQPGDKTGQQSSTSRPNGQPLTMPENGKDGTNQNLQTYSGTRAQDLKDPNIKSKEDAENLLDSLKDDERHVNARSLNGDNPVPPPPSGKDW
jgi:Ca-activated chloride channel family protein